MSEMRRFDAVPDENPLDLVYYLILLRNVVYKYYLWIIPLCIAGVLAAYAHSRTLIPTYTATVTLHVAPKQDLIFENNRWWRDEVAFEDTQIGILRSNKLTMAVAEELRLYDTTAFSLDRPTITQRIKAWLGIEEVVVSPSEEAKIRSASSRLRGRVGVRKPTNREESKLLNVSVTLLDRELAVITADAIAREYLDIAKQNEMQEAIDTQNFLSERLRHMRTELRDAETALQDYRESQNIVQPSGQDELDQELSSITSQVFALRQQVQELQTLEEQIKATRNNLDKLGNVPTIAKDNRVSTLKNSLITLDQKQRELAKRYGSRHMKMIEIRSQQEAARSALRAQIDDVIEIKAAELVIGQRALETAEVSLAEIRGRKQERGRTGYELRELEQDVQTKRDLYALFVERLNREDATGPVHNTNLWVADPARITGAGTGQSAQQLMLFALIGCLLAGLGAGVLLELNDKTLETAEDVERKLGVELLGVLPKIESDDDDVSPLTEYREHPHSRFAEAVRSVRTSLTLMNLNRKPHRMLITSSASHEGKTSLSLSLAASFAQVCRVLLIDADLRKPSLERILRDSHHQVMGLADVIAGVESFDDAVFRDESDDLDVLFAGSRSLNPLELLASPQFTRLMSEVSDQYDVIIVDSPPCLSVSDGYLLSAHTDSVVYVVEAAKTKVASIHSALNRFQNLDVSIAGILLNIVDFSARHMQGRYQEYYAYPGYGEHHEEEEKHEA